MYLICKPAFFFKWSENDFVKIHKTIIKSSVKFTLVFFEVLKKNANTKQVKKYLPWMIVSPRIAFKIRFMLEVLPSKTNWSIVDRDDF